MTIANHEYFKADFENPSTTVSEAATDQLRPSINQAGYYAVARIVDSTRDDEEIPANFHADGFETQEQKIRRLTRFTGDVDTFLGNTEAADPTPENYEELLGVTHDLLDNYVPRDEQLAEWLNSPSRFLSKILYDSRDIREGLDGVVTEDAHPSAGNSLYFKTGENRATKVTWFNRFGDAPDLGERGKIKRSQWAKYKLHRSIVDNPLMRVLSYDVDMSSSVELITANGININRDGKIYPISARGIALAKSPSGTWALPFARFLEKSVLPVINEGNRIADATIASRGIGDIAVGESSRSAAASSTIDTLKNIVPDNLLLAIPMGRMITRGELAEVLPTMSPRSFVDIEQATSSLAQQYRGY